MRREMTLAQVPAVKDFQGRGEISSYKRALLLKGIGVQFPIPESDNWDFSSKDSDALLWHLQAPAHVCTYTDKHKVKVSPF